MRARHSLNIKRWHISGRNINWGMITMVVPVVVYFLVFHYVPMVGLIIAFKNFVATDGIVASPWVGLDNFRHLFSDHQFFSALVNTVVISLLRIIFGFFAPLALAIMLSEVRNAWFRSSVQSITFMPHFFSWVILGGISLMLLSGQGPFNDALAILGLGQVGFLTEGNWFLGTIVVTGIWQSAGYGAVIYLAALAGISPDLYEAAEIDGASRLQKIAHITLPCLVPTIITLFILNLAHVLSAGFDQIYNMYNPLVFDVSDILDTFILRRMMSLDFSFGTAAGMFKSVVGLMFIVAANSLARRMSKGEQGVY